MNRTHANEIRNSVIVLFAFLNSTFTIAAVAVFCFYFVSPIGPPEHGPPELLIPQIGIYFLFTTGGAFIAGWASRSAPTWPALAATGPYLLLTFGQSNFRAVANLIGIAMVTFVAYYGIQRLFKANEHKTSA